MGLSATMLVENNGIKLSKESATKTLSNLEDAYLFYLPYSGLFTQGAIFVDAFNPS